MVEKYKKWFDENRGAFFDFYYNYVSFPSVGAQQERKEETLACCDFLEKKLKNIGLEVQRWECDHFPILFAQRIVDPKLPTVLLYGHYDVQPAEPLELWHTDPFKPTEKDGRVYARGASDNKGQSSYTIGAVEAFLQIGAKDQVNIKICIEGDEETGSKGLDQIAMDKKDELAADYVLIIDVEVPALDRPVVTLGMRGVTTLAVNAIGADHDLHSGAFGGVVANPAKALIEAAATLWDQYGKVAVDGFYDGIVPLTDEEKEALDTTIDFEKALADVGGRAKGNPKGCELWEANWAMPTLEVNGINSGYSGEQVKTIIPAKARLMLSARLVPGQDPNDVLEKIASHLKKKIAPGIDLEVEYGHSGVGIRTTPRSTIAALCKKAYETVTGKKCGLALCGATIGIAQKLVEASGGEMVGMGYGLTKDEIHAPNESFGLDQLELGFLTVTELLEEIAHADRT